MKTVLLTIEVNAEQTQPTEQSKMMKNVMRFMGVCMIPAAMQFPVCLSLYWNTSNLFSLTQCAFFKIPGVKPALNIMPPPPPSTSSSSSTESTLSFSNLLRDKGDDGSANIPFADARNAVRKRESANLAAAVKDETHREISVSSVTSSEKKNRPLSKKGKRGKKKIFRKSKRRQQ